MTQHNGPPEQTPGAKMIFHIPHASPHIPSGLRPKITLPAEELARELVKITDWFTDDLFGCHAEREDSVVTFPVSRLVVDPERFLEDMQEPMAKVGMGVVYVKTSDGLALRAEPTAAERDLLIGTYYRPHHKRLSEAVNAELQRGGRALVLDCHSFPSKPLPYESDQNPERPDICIGTDEFHTPQRLLTAVEDQCRAEGFSCATNRPFAGSIVPIEHYRTNPSALSIMIEINRKLYMDEEKGAKSETFENCRLLIGSLVEAIRLA